MLNPSVADEHGSDATLNRCIRYSGDWGYMALEIVNLFPLVSTDPARLRAASDRAGEFDGIANAAHISQAVQRSDKVIVAYGVHAKHRELAATLKALPETIGSGVTVYALKVTKDGYPSHPVRLRADLVPEIYRWS